MMPIQDLLHRIRWDREFGAARFELAYHDRVAKSLVRVPLASVRLPEGRAFFVEIVDPDGTAQEVPLHRVHAVWRDGALIWSR